MRRGTIIVIVFVLAAIVIVGVSQFLRTQPPLVLTVAVNPLAERWVRASLEALNATNPLVNSAQRVQFQVVPIEDMAVWQDERRANWTPENHPVAWIPAAAMTVNFARDARFPFEVAAESVAQTPLMWGGFAERVNVITGDGAQTFDWAAVQAAAETESWAALGGQATWQFFKLAFDRPDQSVNGLAVLLSAAGGFTGDAVITPSITNGREFRDWFEPVARSVPSFNTLGNDPVAAMASRGASLADVALQPESRWLNNLSGLSRQGEVRLAYPAYTFLFTFPVARWNDSTVTPEQRDAVTVLVNWLTSGVQQARAVEFGLRPASGVLPENAPLFEAGTIYGAELSPVFTGTVQALPRTETQRLLQWFNGVR